MTHTDSKRFDGDDWDLASSVGATATMVAAGRALGSRETNPLVDDPYAAPLVRAVGIEFFVKLVDGTLALDEESRTQAGCWPASWGSGRGSSTTSSPTPPPEPGCGRR